MNRGMTRFLFSLFLLTAGCGKGNGTTFTLRLEPFAGGLLLPDMSVELVVRESGGDEMYRETVTPPARRIEFAVNLDRCVSIEAYVHRNTQVVLSGESPCMHRESIENGKIYLAPPFQPVWRDDIILGRACSDGNFVYFLSPTGGELLRAPLVALDEQVVQAVLPAAEGDAVACTENSVYVAGGIDSSGNFVRTACSYGKAGLHCFPVETATSDMAAASLGEIAAFCGGNTAVGKYTGCMLVHAGAVSYSGDVIYVTARPVIAGADGLFYLFSGTSKVYALSYSLTQRIDTEIPETKTLSAVAFDKGFYLYRCSDSSAEVGIVRMEDWSYTVSGTTATLLSSPQGVGCGTGAVFVGPEGLVFFDGYQVREFTFQPSLKVYSAVALSRHAVLVATDRGTLLFNCLAGTSGSRAGGEK